MRIHLNLAPAATGNTSQTVQDVPDPESVPAPLLKLAPSGELFLIELQGALEFEGEGEGSEGQMLGQIEFEPGREDKPTLLISHHRLEGKIVSLPKPLAVLEKRHRGEADGASKDGAPNVSSVPPAAPTPPQSNGRRPRQPLSSPPLNGFGGPIPPATPDGDDSDDDERGGPASSPSNLRKRSGEGGSSGLPDLKRRKPNTPAHPLSSSPAVPARRGAEAYDFSSSPVRAPIRPLPRNGDTKPEGKREDGEADDALNDLPDPDELEEAAADATTATYYDVLCVVKRKILFAKRPEPVVKLAGAAMAAA